METGCRGGDFLSFEALEEINKFKYFEARGEALWSSCLTSIPRARRSCLMTPSWARSGVLEEPNDLTNRWKCRCTNEWGRRLEHVMDFIVHGKVQLALIPTAKRISKTASSWRRWVLRWCRSNTECRLTASRGIKSQLNALIVFLPYPLNKGTENVSILLKRRALNPL